MSSTPTIVQMSPLLCTVASLDRDLITRDETGPNAPMELAKPGMRVNDLVHV
jgi:hypothetical protein